MDTGGQVSAPQPLKGGGMMPGLREIDVFIVSSLTFLFTYAVWGIDISVGAIGTGAILKNLFGYANPYDFYHFNIHLLTFIWFFTIGYLCIRFHYARWKNEQNK